MVYVPIHAASTPSARAQELGERLAKVITEYESSHPDLSALERSQATQIALALTTPAAGAAPARVLALALGAAVLAMAIGLAAARGALAERQWTAIAVVTAILAALTAFAVLRRR